MIGLFEIVLGFSSFMLILLILMHRGQEGGMSSMFGGGIESAARGSSVAERNLNRLTIGIGTIWLVSIIALNLLMKVNGN